MKYNCDNVILSLKEDYSHLMPNRYLSRGEIYKMYKNRTKTVCIKCGKSFGVYSYGSHLKEHHYIESIFSCVDDENLDLHNYEYDALLNKKFKYIAEQWHLEYIKEMYGHRMDFKLNLWMVNYQNALSHQKYYTQKILEADFIYNSEHSRSYFERLQEQLSITN